MRCERDLVRVALVCSGHHLSHSVASNIATSLRPGGPARVIENGDGKCGDSRETRVVEELQPGSEMLLRAGKVTTIIARYYLEHLGAPKDARTAFANGKLESLVRKRPGCRRVPINDANTQKDNEIRK